MQILRFALTSLLMSTAIFSHERAAAQSYPNKPVRIVTSEPGGTADLVTRLISAGITGSLGQSVIVQNKGGSVVSIETVANAQPDGYSLLLTGSTMWLLPLLQSKISYDPIKDFAPITMTHRVPNVLVVHPAVPAKSLKELIALAKAKPGELNYASGATGTSNHLAGELLNSMAGIKIVRITYKGTGPSLNALIGGEVQLMFATAGGVAPYIKSGRVRALAVSSAQPSSLAPGLPTMAAAGLPGYESSATAGVVAPAKTPPAVINRLNQEIVRVLTRPDIKERLFDLGVDVVADTPQEFAATMKSDITTTGQIIKAAGIKE